MAMKSIEEEIKAAELRVQQAKARLQRLEALRTRRERRLRTRRLIQVGTVMARLGVTTEEQAETLRKEILKRSSRLREWWTKTVGPLPASSSEEPRKKRGGA